MRTSFAIQPLLGNTVIEQLTFDPTSRDDTEVLCYALQTLWCDRDTRDTVLGLIEACHSQQVDCQNGRPGMTFWQVLVVAVIKQGLDVDYDRLANLMSYHRALRDLAGYPNFMEAPHVSSATLANNISLLSDEVLAEINRAIVNLGHHVVGHRAEDILKARGDSFVVETDVEYPTDLRLLWDAIRAGIGQQVRLCTLLGVPGWRQAKHWKKMLKKAFQKASRVRRHHGLFEKIIRNDLVLADHLIKKLTRMSATLEAASAGV